jgi:hypothetical protein
MSRYNDEHAGNPLYPNLPSVAKHRRLNDQTPDGKKAYGQAVHAAIRALQRHIPAKVASEEDYYRALLESRGVDVAQIIRLATGKAKYRLGLWLKAAWNVIKGKRGTPYLVEKDTMPAPEPIAARPWDERHAGEVHKQTGNIIAVEKAAPKRRGRPPGSKNRPKPVYSPGQQAAA